MENRFLYHWIWVVILGSSTIHTSAGYCGNFDSRQGFFYGFGISGSRELKEVKDTSMGLTFRIGGGLTDQILLFINSYLNQYDFNGPNEVTIQGVEFAASYMFSKDEAQSPYILLGAGFGFDGLHQNTGYDIGPSLSSGIGVEFRILKSFVMQPDVIFHFIGTNGQRYMMLNFGLNLLWY